MKEKWALVRDRFEAFEVRERLLLVGALVAVVYLAWDFILLQPISEAKKIAVAQERIAQQSIQALEAELVVLDSVSKRDPDVRLRQELAQLQEKLNALDVQLASLAVGLIKVEDLPVMLHQMLAQTQSLQLLSLTTLPVELIELRAEEETTATEGGATDDNGSAQMAQLFKHGVQVKLEGNYSAVYEFLKTLEDSDWQFYWESVNYDVKEYPKALMTLRVFTLASDKGVFDRDMGVL